MKMKIFSLLLIAFSVLTTNCTKNTENTSNCKTCKAFGPNGTTEEEVCSEAEETAFRNANAGREISCQ